jgi:hypothetical protein
MNRTSILKGLAICSSVLLAGGFVAYRQRQAADPSNHEVPMMPSSKSRQVASPSFEFSEETPENPEVFLPSSKRIEMPEKPAEDPSTEKKKNPTLLPSSKNIDAILRNPSQQKTSPVPANPGSSARYAEGKTLLPSSKIGAILTPKDVTEEKKVEPAPDPEEKDEP